MCQSSVGESWLRNAGKRSARDLAACLRRPGERYPNGAPSVGLVNLSPRGRGPGLPRGAVAVPAFSPGDPRFAPWCLGRGSSRQAERRQAALERGGVVERGPATLWAGSPRSGVVTCAGTRGCKRQGRAGSKEGASGAFGRGGSRGGRRGDVLDGRRGKG